MRYSKIFLAASLFACMSLMASCEESGDTGTEKLDDAVCLIINGYTCLDGATTEQNGNRYVCILKDGCSYWFNTDPSGATYSPNANQCTNECVEGQTRCSGTASQLCGRNINGCTTWFNSDAVGLNCQACDNACAPGDEQCRSGVPMKCVVGANNCGQWTSAPESNVCKSTCQNNCTPGSEVCIASAPFSCVLGSDGCYSLQPNTASSVCVQTPQGCNNNCTVVGVSQCIAGVAMTCQNLNGCVTLNLDSTSDACTCSNVCTENQETCDNGVPKRCVRGNNGCTSWVGTSSDICTKCTDECTENEEKCDNGASKICLRAQSGCTLWVDSSNDVCGKQCPVNCMEGDLQCSSNVLQICRMGDSGCPEWTTKQVCPFTCSNKACQCKSTCSEGAYKCSGKNLLKCTMGSTGCNDWQVEQTCQAYCDASKYTCSDNMPRCDIRPGFIGEVQSVTDGDTMWIKAAYTGNCNTKLDNGDQIRFDIRVLGIDAPECTKKRGSDAYHSSTAYNHCIPDSSTSYKNELMGYEAYVAAVTMIPVGSRVEIGCDSLDSNGLCTLDTTDSRYVAYLGFTKNNASYDFSTEMARKGMAFANVEFAKTTSKIGEICAAQKEAYQKHVGVWSLDSTMGGVLSKMSGAKQSNLKNLEARCNNLIK